MFGLRYQLLSLTAIFAFSSLSFGEEADPRDTPLVKAVQNCRDFVVNIHTEKNAEETDSRFFASKSRRVSGMGTGIVVDERGYIVTNYHVIHEVDTITVTLKNGETHTARPVSFDRRQDMAIIYIKPASKLKVMPMGTSTDVRLAEQVYAVGNAFGYEYTVTAGIISALGRDVEVDETQAYENLIQTDASINPGNSGGPLLNLKGEVIGINVAIRAGAQRIGFAIPIDDARKTIGRLLATEQLNGVEHGLTGRDQKSPKAKKLIVSGVARGSSSDKCGLKAGDWVKQVRDIHIHDQADWERSLLDIPQGEVLDVVVDRNGETLNLRYPVGNRSSSVARKPSAAQTKTVSLAKPKATPTVSKIRSRMVRQFGLHLTDLAPAERSRLGSRLNGGLKIVKVDANSPAARGLIQAGDVLIGLNRYETLSDSNLEFIMKGADQRRLTRMPFQIYRNRLSLKGIMAIRR